jgi:hypothetical protein
MKKILGLVLVMVTLLLVLSACGSQEPIDAARFRAVMEEAGYEVIDVTNAEDLTALRDDVYYVLLAVGDDYQFEFYEFIDTREAVQMYNILESLIESWRGGSASDRSVNMPSHSMFELTSAGIFSRVDRVGNSIIFVTTDVEHRDAIREVMNNF